MKKSVLILSFFISLPPSLAHAGLIVGGTRFIFSGEDPSLSIRVQNPDPNDYLVVTKVLLDDGQQMQGTMKTEAVNKEIPFAPVPPLFNLMSGKEGLIRILKTDGALSSDRESLFWLSIAAIPASPDKRAQNALQIAVRVRMKLFYRPADLTGRPDEAYSQLHWSRDGKEVTVKNTSPFYVTLVKMSSNGKPVPLPGMIAPYSKRMQPWCPAEGRCRLQWQSLNDYGKLMPAKDISFPLPFRADKEHES